MKKVFISYSTKDKETAAKVKAALEKQNIEVTIDSESLAAGGNIHDFIDKSIREKQVTLLIVSKNSLTSDWVGLEIVESLAAERYLDGKQFIPCCIDNTFQKNDTLRRVVVKIKEQIALIDQEIDELKKIGIEHPESHLESKSRKLKLVQNLPGIIKRLKGSLTLDISGNQFDESMKRIIAAIHGHSPRIANVNPKDSKLSNTKRNTVYSLMNDEMVGNSSNPLDQFAPPLDMLKHTFHRVNFTNLKNQLITIHDYCINQRKGVFALCSFEKSLRAGVDPWGIDAIQESVKEYWKLVYGNWQLVAIKAIPLRDNYIPPVVDRELIIRRLAGFCGIDPDESVKNPSLLIDAVPRKMHENEKVIVVIHDGQHINTNDWNWLVTDFWKNIRDQLLLSKNQTGIVFMLFVLIGTEFQGNQVEHIFCDKKKSPDLSKIQKLPIELKWKKNDLHKYILQYWKPRLGLDDSSLETIVNNIFDPSDGVPELLFKQFNNHLVSQNNKGEHSGT